jgi:hypothetical protein
MNWSSLFQAVLLLGGSGAAGIAFKGFFDRKKIRVDGVAVLSETALEQVESMAKEVKGLRQDITLFRGALREHEVWDRKVIRKLEEAGINMEDPPNLWVI